MEREDIYKLINNECSHCKKYGLFPESKYKADYIIQMQSMMNNIINDYSFDKDNEIIFSLILKLISLGVDCLENMPIKSLLNPFTPIYSQLQTANGEEIK